jgi:hypothetical protein
MVISDHDVAAGSSAEMDLRMKMFIDSEALQKEYAESAVIPTPKQRSPATAQHDGLPPGEGNERAYARCFPPFSP